MPIGLYSKLEIAAFVYESNGTQDGLLLYKMTPDTAGGWIGVDWEEVIDAQ